MKTRCRLPCWLVLSLAVALAGCGGGSAPLPSGAEWDMPAQNLSALPVSDAYSLELQAMQDVDHRTDVYLTLRPKDASVAPAATLKQAQLKSFDTSGKLRWTKNAFDVPATVDASRASTATLTYNDMLRYQPVQAHVLAQTGQTIRTQVLKTSAPVKLRPDLAVSDVQVMEQALVGQVVNITATLRELNGDLDATARVVLQRDGAQIDEATAVRVNRGGFTQVVFSARFDQPGDYTLVVAAREAQPRDYDESNNSRTFTVRVTGTLHAVGYTMTYNAISGKWSWDWRSPLAEGHQDNEGEQQSLDLALASSDPTRQLRFPITSASVRVAVDGGPALLQKQFAIGNVQQSASGCRVTTSGSSGADPSGLSLYVQVVDDCGMPTTFVSFNQQATDFVYYSSRHDYYWGTPSSIGPIVNRGGTFLRPTRSLEARLVVCATAVCIGGDARIPQVTTQPDVGTYSWEWEGYSETDVWDYLRTWGSSTGITQP